ncbi:DUF6086 family protein [Planosporangium sp. 12N6]|uniref:DUF6086 family protein n=1 Tax=Planosporangium spinosum TaxID=3402278 RepID=UPI003CEE5013
MLVLTHHPRKPLTMAGGTTFTFVTDGIESALEQARKTAGDDDVASPEGPPRSTSTSPSEPRHWSPTSATAYSTKACFRSPSRHATQPGCSMTDHGRMSQYFNVNGTSVWNPASTVAQLFFLTARAMVVVTNKPHGIHDLGTGEYDIDVPAYEAFVDELARRYLDSGHPILVQLIEGFLPTALALLRKGGGDVPVLAETAAGDRERASCAPGGVVAIERAERVLAEATDLATKLPA